MTISIEEMAVFAKSKGIAFANSEIYGGLAGFFDFGPLGVEIKNNIKQQLWKSFVQSRADVVGIDGSIISSSRIWEASGHVGEFTDPILLCNKCKSKFKGDDESIADNKCTKCGSDLVGGGDVNLMFKTNVGSSIEDSYLRPETAQLIFTNYKNILNTARVKLPFGIAQIGKAFRNEISPRDFLFRLREFEQFEIEYFTHPAQTNEVEDFDSIKDLKLNCLTAEQQEQKKDHAEFTIDKLLKNKVFSSRTHAYWIAIFYKWFVDHGIDPSNLRLREHMKGELAHYAGACVDIEYKFPFGWKEIHGNADRKDFDLTQHAKASNSDMTLHIEETKEKVVPVVAAEPSQGIERAMLAFLFDAYDEDKKRGNIVLHFHPSIAPIQVGVFPLVNKLKDQSMELYNNLKSMFVCQYDKSGSIGRRYARADEQGIPYCITFDFDSLEDKSVTVRDRDTTKQDRIKIEDLPMFLHKKLF